MHNNTAAEKNLPRLPAEVHTLEEIVQKCEQTFTDIIHKPFVHPTNPRLKLKAQAAPAPSRTSWAEEWRQVIFDEELHLRGEQKELGKEMVDKEMVNQFKNNEISNPPAILWGSEGKGNHSLFGLLQPDTTSREVDEDGDLMGGQFGGGGRGAHRLERQYIILIL